jgi:hypothetical protein
MGVQSHRNTASGLPLNARPPLPSATRSASPPPLGSSAATSRPEGGTLAYLIRFRGHQVLAFGGMNYIEREIEGLRPDVVLVGASPSRTEIYDYTSRLMHDLGFPSLVLLTHWDDFLVPYTASQQPAIDALQSFVQEVKAASPKTKVIVPKYFEPITLETAAH